MIFGRHFYIFCFIIQHLFFASSELKSPNITYCFGSRCHHEFKFNDGIVDHSWLELLLPETNQRAIYTNNMTAFTAPPYIECKAFYPIQWKIQGYIRPIAVIDNLAPHRKTRNTLFPYQLELRFETFSKVPKNMGLSASFVCEAVENPNVRDELLVFFQPFSGDAFIKQKAKILTNSKVIPCSTKNPMTNVTLHKIDENGKEHQLARDLAKFYPTLGFKSERAFEGIYICRQEGFTVTFNASSTDSDDFQVSPHLTSISAFINDPIQFECSSRSFKNVKLFVESSSSLILNISYVTSKSYHRIIVVSFNDKVRYSYKRLTGKVSCVANSSSNDTNSMLVKTWTFKFVKPPELILPPNMNVIVCDSYYPAHLQIVECENRIVCNYRARCLDNIYPNCRQKLIKNSVGRFFPDEPSQLIEIKDAFSQGMADCAVEGLHKRWEYFESLDCVKYDDYKKAPKQELLRITDVPRILYTTEIVNLDCVGVLYLFPDEWVNFQIEYQNKSRNFLKTNKNTVNITTVRDPYNRRSITNLLIYLPIDAIGIHCVAHVAYSSDVILASAEFETRNLIYPHFDEIHGKDLTDVNFYTNEKNQRLSCQAHGEPQLEYVWFFNNLTVNNSFPELSTSSGENGQNYLEFPEIMTNDMEKYNGIYECMVKNRLGREKVEFRLTVFDKPNEGKNVVYIVTFVPLSIIGIVMTTIVIFVRRYLRNRKSLRDLTDEEIKEFVQGRPDLIGNFTGRDSDTVDLLPYNSEYEIPMSDLDFTFSENKFLGSGQFAFVLRGLIISKGKPVALKISKPTTDVNLFKSLLSEVKIMIYIGDHKNVVRLIGVCTEAIKSRSLYIATDICEQGSLHSFLRKSKPSFLSLINANQEIEISLKPELNQVTTLNLIYFATQIATGMEFLSYKSIIHADLATRNVLITSDNIAKISDFGLSRRLYESSNYVKKTKAPLPWRWMALESLKTLTFSTKSDIWAYGVTLYEIFTIGDVPFPNETWNDQFVERLENGLRMGRPKYSTREIYSKIVECWENDPDLRPSFTEIREFFEKMFEKFCGYDEKNILLEGISSIEDVDISSNCEIYIDLESQIPLSRPNSLEIKEK